MARIKVDADEGEGVYHCVTRTVNGEHLLDDVAKEVLRRQLWQIADYGGVQVLTYAILSNHFHVLLRVPRRVPVEDTELLRRYAVLYPKPTKFQTSRISEIKRQLVTNGPEAIAWRRQQLQMMGDVSPFMKLLKQRFSTWFNRTHQRYGTLWAERFKSVLIQPQALALRTVGAYIDLNAVRAGLTTDPGSYRFCGYGEALAGGASAQQGIIRILFGKDWRSAQAIYRQTLFGTGTAARKSAGTVSPEAFARVVRERGQLPLAVVLRHRVRYFTDGAVLGSQAFVEGQLARYRRASGRRQRTASRPIPPVTDWGGLATLRGLRRGAFG